MQVSNTAANSDSVPVCGTRQARKGRPCNLMRGDAYGRELLNAAHRQGQRHFSSSQQPAEMPVRHQCSALRSAIALPPCTAYSAAGWSSFGSCCGSSASSPLTACWTTRAAEWPPASRSVRQTGAHRSRNVLPPICTIADNLAPRAGYGRSEQPRGQHVISNCPGRHYYSMGVSRHDRVRRWTAPDAERVTAGIVARSIPSVLERYVVPRDSRTTPSAPFTSDVRRGLLRARTTTPLANSHQLFWPIHCNPPVRGPTNSIIDSAFRTSCARRLKIRMADGGVITSPTLLQASSK